MRKGPIHEVANAKERKFRVRGVPSRYLRFTNDDTLALFRAAAVPTEKRNPAKLRGFTYEREWAKGGQSMHVTVDRQKVVLDEIFNHEALQRTAPIVGVGTYPTDHLGIKFGAAVCRRASDLGLRPMMINTKNNPSMTIPHEPDVVVLYNITNDCDAYKATKCRDWISNFEDTFVIVVVAGADPVTFFHTRLHMHIDTALYFRGD